MEQQLDPPSPESESEKELSLGIYLKNQREMRQVSHAEIARVTKINIGILKNIETDNYSRLPSPPFVKGFLASIGKYLGLDTHDLLLRYEQVLKNNPHYASHRASPLGRDPNQMTPHRPTAQTPTNRAPSKSQESFHFPETSSFEKWFNKKTVPIFIVVILLAVILSLLKSVGRQSVEVVDVPPEAAAPPAPPAEIQAPPAPTQEALPMNPPADSAMVPPTAESANPTPEVPKVTHTSGSAGPQEIKIKAKVETFVKVQIANQEIQNISLRAGETTSFTTNESIRLFVLNAGSMSITHNGKNLGTLGKWGEGKIFEFSAQPKP